MNSRIKHSRCVLAEVTVLPSEEEKRMKVLISEQRTRKGLPEEDKPETQEAEAKLDPEPDPSQQLIMSFFKAAAIVNQPSESPALGVGLVWAVGRVQ